jgi:hypothetical protein
LRELFVKGYAVHVLVEASLVDTDPLDKTRYYKLDATIGSDLVAKVCSLTTKAADGKDTTLKVPLAVTGVDTSEALTSDQSAGITFSGASVVATALKDRVRCMDRVRIELTDGKEWSLGFDGFVNQESSKLTSTNDRYSTSFSISASGLWKFLSQSWFNWQGAIQPGYDFATTKAGDTLFRKLAENPSQPAQNIIKLFINAALGIVKLKTAEGQIRPGKFFEFGIGTDWTSAFDLAYPLPVTTLPTYKGPLSGIIGELAQPDIHECYATYRKFGDTWKPTIIFRPRPYPGGPGDDAGWKALKVNKIKDGPVGKTIMDSRNDGQHPNAFHWSGSSASDAGLTEFQMKLLHGFKVDQRSIDRYGYSARPVGSTLPPLSMVKKDNFTPYITTIQNLMLRVAYQEAPMPELWTRTIQVSMTPGIHVGEILEDWSTGVPWTGYVSTVSHRIHADPWGASTNIGMVRCVQCEAKDYPDIVRGLVQIETRQYVVANTGGAKSLDGVKSAQRGAIDSTCAQPVAGFPFGTGIIKAAHNYGVPPYVLAQVIKCESSYGMNKTHPGGGGGIGIAQFLASTANGLNAMGYPNTFNSSLAASNDCLSIDAAAWYLSYLMKRIATAGLTFSNSFPDPESQFYAWVLYAYNKGEGNATTQGPAQAWAFSPIQRAFVEWKTYWSPFQVKNASMAFAGLK